MTTLHGEDAARLLEELEKGCGPEEMARRVARAKERLATLEEPKRQLLPVKPRQFSRILDLNLDCSRLYLDEGGEIKISFDEARWMKGLNEILGFELPHGHYHLKMVT
jgi:hypothetical protein